MQIIDALFTYVCKRFKYNAKYQYNLYSIINWCMCNCLNYYDVPFEYNNKLQSMNQCMYTQLFKDKKIFFSGSYV